MLIRRTGQSSVIVDLAGRGISAKQVYLVCFYHYYYIRISRVKFLTPIRSICRFCGGSFRASIVFINFHTSDEFHGDVGGND